GLHAREERVRHVAAGAVRQDHGGRAAAAPEARRQRDHRRHRPAPRERDPTAVAGELHGGARRASIARGRGEPRLAARVGIATAAMAAPIVGLTGGIGAGKSTVAAILAELGARVIDADRIGHEVYGPGTEGHASVVQAFGPRVVAPDGTIDRRALGAIVFHDPGALARLNAIVHPLIAAEIQRRVAAVRAEPGAPPIVIEA